MKPVLIVENSDSSLIKENQNSKTGKKDYTLSGTFTQFNVKNRNERIYSADKFLPALQELNERINDLGVVYGEFDHPDVFDTSLSRASHIITKANYVSEKNLVEGEIKLLSTYWGKEARSLVDDQMPVFVSSRAAGVTESNGSVSLKKLFTYDIVADPGFSTARMETRSLNESLGYGNEDTSNFRIYEMSDESKINQLFNMNKNDLVTKKQLTDYSKYLVNELASTKKEVKDAVKSGKMDPNKLDKLVEYYEELNVSNSKVVEYLDYLAEKVQVVVNENNSLKSRTSKLAKHNDYLAENLEKSINYTEYIAENVDKGITESKKLEEKVNKSVSYAEYIAEHVDRNIAYSEYIAEHVDDNIAYSEYIAEHVDNNIAYSEYIAENVDDNIAYSEYIAESLDKSIGFQDLISESLKNGKVFESNEEKIPSLKDVGIEKLTNEEDEYSEFEEDLEEEELHMGDEVEDGDEEGAEEEGTECAVEDEEEEEAPESEEELYNENQDEEEEEDDESDLSESIDKLIEEAKKRKVSETSDMNFLKFLNKSQVDSFYELSNEEQENAKLHINERSYFTQKDVLSLISESLTTNVETLEDRVVRLMPDNVKPIWEKMDNNSKKSVLSQAKLYPESVMQNESQIDHFWSTRNLKVNESKNKELLSEDKLINEDKLSDDDTNAILERFKNL